MKMIVVNMRWVSHSEIVARLFIFKLFHEVGWAELNSTPGWCERYLSADDSKRTECCCITSDNIKYLLRN